MATGGRLRAEGLKSGVPDLCLPSAHGQYHGLYIEMKRTQGSKTTPEQKEWLAGAGGGRLSDGAVQGRGCGD